MKYTIPTLMALSQATGVVCNWTKSAKECRLIRPSQGVTPVLKENPQNTLAEDPTKPSTPVKDLPSKTKTRRGRRAKRPMNPAPAITFAPSETGFAQFLREHSSPRHQRVTAGGRIVPMPFIEDGPVEGPSAQPATTRGPRNGRQDMAGRRLDEPIEQDVSPWSGRWLLESSFSLDPEPATVARAEAPRPGLLPGFDPARDGHPNTDPFVRSLRQSAPLADIAMNRMHPPTAAQQGRTGGDNLIQASLALQSVMGIQPATRTMPLNQQHGRRESHMAQAPLDRQNVMGMRPPVQMVPMARQYGMGPFPGFYPPAQIAPIVPQYAMGAGHMAQSFAPPPNMMMMHPTAHMMPMIHQPGMGFSPAAQMAPMAQQNTMGVRAMPPTVPAQMIPIVPQNSTNVRAMPQASVPMEATTGVRGAVAETRPAVREAGPRLNPTAPEFVHGATVQQNNPARNPAPAQEEVEDRDTVVETQPVRNAAPLQEDVQARDTMMETQSVRNAAPLQEDEQPSWPPVTPPPPPPPRPLEVETPLAFDGSELSSERPLNGDDFDQYATVLSEVVSLILQDVMMPTDDYERRLLFLVNLVISTRGNNEGLRRELLKVLQCQEECLTEKLQEVNREIALFELNSRRQPQSESRPDFVALRVYWSLAKGMTATAIEHLERIGRENEQRQSEESGRSETLREDEDRADFEALENALAHVNFPLDPEMTIADSQFELAPALSDILEETDQSERNLNHRQSNIGTGQEMSPRANETLEPYERGNEEANEASQPSPLGQETQSPSADAPANEATETPATEVDTSAQPPTAGLSSPRSGNGNDSQATGMDRSPDAENRADIDMPRRAHRRAHSLLLVQQLVNRRMGGAPVPRAVSTTAVSPVHASDGPSLDGPDRSHD